MAVGRRATSLWGVEYLCGFHVPVIALVRHSELLFSKRRTWNHHTVKVILVERPREVPAVWTRSMHCERLRDSGKGCQSSYIESKFRSAIKKALFVLWRYWTFPKNLNLRKMKAITWGTQNMKSFQRWVFHLLSSLLLWKKIASNLGSDGWCWKSTSCSA